MKKPESDTAPETGRATKHRAKPPSVAPPLVLQCVRITHFREDLGNGARRFGLFRAVSTCFDQKKCDIPPTLNCGLFSDRF
jgi:hypothetical protein